MKSQIERKMNLKGFVFAVYEESRPVNVSDAKVTKCLQHANIS